MYRKGVSALIMNQKGEFLLVNLKSFKEIYHAIPGGGLEENETLKDAVYREIKEELNINSSDLELIGESRVSLITKFISPKIDKKGDKYIGSERFFFGFRFKGVDDNIKPADGEVIFYRWSSFSDLGKYLLFEKQLDDTVAKINEIFGKI